MYTLTWKFLYMQLHNYWICRSPPSLPDASLYWDSDKTICRNSSSFGPFGTAISSEGFFPSLLTDLTHCVKTATQIKTFSTQANTIMPSCSLACLMSTKNNEIYPTMNLTRKWTHLGIGRIKWASNNGIIIWLRSETVVLGFACKKTNCIFICNTFKLGYS